VANYLRHRNRLSEACELAREAIRHCDYNGHILECLIQCLLAAGLFQEAATAVNTAPDWQIESEENSTARNILSWALEHLPFAQELSADRLKRCIELAAEYSRIENPDVCQLCGK
jgi:hypothetical protein